MLGIGLHLTDNVCFCLFSVVEEGTIGIPTDICGLSVGTVSTAVWQKGFADVNELLILTWESTLQYMGGLYVSTKVFVRGKQES